MSNIGDIIKFGEHDWLVLDKREGASLIISEYITEQYKYHSATVPITWERCDLRSYLNGEFYNSFGEADRNRIVKTVNANPDNPWYGTKGGKDTEDYIFALSLEEAVKYFGDSGDLKNRRGWYWENSEFILKDGRGGFINDSYNNRRVAKYEGENDWWWLRTPGENDYCAARVGYVGRIRVIGIYVNYKRGIRPAMWITDN